MKWRILVAIVGALLSFGLAASPAGAQAARTWVSSSGSDLNPCTRRLPCLTFALALIRTIDGGEINCVDPGGFGPVLVITKSVTIDCGGMFGSAFASGTTGFTIDDSRTTAPQSITVTLRNLSINGGTVMSPGGSPAASGRC